MPKGICPLVVVVVALVFAAHAQGQTGSLSVLKQTSVVGNPTLFSFDLTGPGVSQTFELQSSESTTFDLPAGTYIVSELVPPDWELSLIRCGTEFMVGPVVPGESGALEFDLGAGQSILCRFHNTYNAVPPGPGPPPEIPAMSFWGRWILVATLLMLGVFWAWKRG